MIKHPLLLILILVGPSLKGEAGMVDSGGKEVIASTVTELNDALKDPKIRKIILETGAVFKCEKGITVDTRAGDDAGSILLITGNATRREQFPKVYSPVTVSRSNVVIQKIHFIDTELNFTAETCGSGGKVLACYFENATADFTQPDMEVAYNELWDVHSIGFEFKFPVLGHEAWAPGDPRWKGAGDGAFRAHVHHNYFHDWHGSGNGHEAFRIGASNHHRFWEADSTAEYNLMVNVAVPGEGETISIKTSCNTIRFNTLVDCQSISQRLGYGNHYYGNYILDSHGIAIRDGRIINGNKRGNLIYGNTLVNCRLGIHARAGFSDPDKVDYIWNKANDKGDPARGIHRVPIPTSYEVTYPLAGWNHVSRLAPNYTVIAGNRMMDSPIEIGRRTDNEPVPPSDTVLFGNKYINTIDNSEHKVASLVYTCGNNTFPHDPGEEQPHPPSGYANLDVSQVARRLDPDEVGPSAFMFNQQH